MSPQNSATMTSSRKLDAKKNMVTAKFAAPAVASPTRSALPPPSRRPDPEFDPNFTASETMIGRAMTSR